MLYQLFLSVRKLVRRRKCETPLESSPDIVRGELMPLNDNSRAVGSHFLLVPWLVLYPGLRTQAVN